MRIVHALLVIFSLAMLFGSIAIWWAGGDPHVYSIVLITSIVAWLGQRELTLSLKIKKLELERAELLEGSEGFSDEVEAWLFEAATLMCIASGTYVSRRDAIQAILYNVMDKWNFTAPENAVQRPKEPT